MGQTVENLLQLKIDEYSDKFGVIPKYALLNGATYRKLCSEVLGIEEFEVSEENGLEFFDCVHIYHNGLANNNIILC